MQTSAGAPTPSCPASRNRGCAAGRGRDAGEPVRERNAILRGPFERQRQQELEARRARLGFAERQLLGVVVDRRVIGAHEVDGAVGKAGAQRGAVAGSAQRRHQTALRVEPADVDVAQMQVMHARRRRSPAASPASRRAPSRRPRRSTAGTDARARRSRGPARRSSPARSSPPPAVSPAGRAASRPRRRARRRPCARCESCGRSQTRWPNVAAYCIARSSTPVSVSGASACENATQPASASSPISVSSTPWRPTVSAPIG